MIHRDVKVLATSTTFKVAQNDGIIYLLTRCCDASATGTTQGVACRGCYRPIPEFMGSAWLMGDQAAADRLQEELTRYLTQDDFGLLAPTVAFTIALEARRVPSQG